MKALMIAATVLFSTSLLGQQQERPPYSQPPPYVTPPSPGNSPDSMPPDTRAPGPLSPSNTEVQQQIQTKVSTEPILRDSGVQISVDDQSVTLTGTVDSEQQHDSALRIAQSYAGDRTIVDKLTIRSQS